LRRPRVAYMMLLLGGWDIPEVVWDALFSSGHAPTVPAIAMSLDPTLASSYSCLLMRPVGVLSLLLFGEYFGNIYDILIALVFGFSSLSVLGLAANRAEPRRGLNFGEVLAVTAVVVSVGLWGWEMLQLFHIFPIKLRP